MAEARKVTTVARFGSWFPGMLTPALAEQSTPSGPHSQHTLRACAGFQLVLKSFTAQSCCAELSFQPLLLPWDLARSESRTSFQAWGHRGGDGKRKT